MGMSASQIRYCMLQARKSDIEFQGQQINQQRTTLATQSAAYNTEMLTMSVPTPPSTEEFTTTTYTYTYNGSEYKIKGTNYMSESYTVQDGDQEITCDAGTYIIDYTTRQTLNRPSRGSKYDVSQVQATDENGQKVYDAEGNPVYTNQIVVVLDGETFYLTEVDEEGGSTPEEILHKTNVANIKENSDNAAEIKNSKFYQAEIGQGKYAYFLADDVTKAFSSNTLSNLHNTVQSYVVSAQSVDVQGKLYGAQITWTDTGRMSSIKDMHNRTCSLDVSTVADDKAYEQAYNEYLFQKDVYNKKMEDINSQLSVIQSQDKKLELELRNLDTQESAIKAEMDAVKSVCKDNIDKSFSVFS